MRRYIGEVRLRPKPRIVKRGESWRCGCLGEWYVGTTPLDAFRFWCSFNRPKGGL